VIKESLAKLMNRQDLAEAEMVEATNEIMEGQATPAQIGAFLTVLRLKGETIDEITGAARVMREKSAKVTFTAPTVIDTCGTGGDGAHTFNISTTAAFIVAAAGVPVAKHGNRAMSSHCGSADVLEALGVKVDLAPKRVESCLKEAGIGFMFAPVFHAAMKHVAAPRRELGFRTVFNVLGPLTNPAGANCQLIGVFHPDLTGMLAEVLNRLGTRRAMVVHGGGGLDELALEGENKVSLLDNGKVTTYTVNAVDLGLENASSEMLRGESPEVNAALTLAILRGEETGPKQAVVLLNAAAALFVAGVVNNLKDGLQVAKELLLNGKAYEKLTALQKATMN
jgi:anthranilate phosphoribosyltransferase